MINSAIQAFFKKNNELQGQAPCAVAVSGGPDSMALAHGLIKEYPDTIFHILSVDHGLRVEAASELDAVEAWSKNYPNALFQRFVWEGEKPDTGVMEAARTERYRLMCAYCTSHNIKHLFLGHHQDDQAETFLIRLTKGSGIDGLAGMDSISALHGVLLCRPFLSVSKEDILSYCASQKISFSEDPSNTNDKYLRPRLRDIRQTLEEEGLTNKRLSHTARRLARASRALEDMTEKSYGDCVQLTSDHEVTIHAESLSHWPDEIRFRVLKKALEYIQPESEYGTRYKRIEDLHHDIWGCYDCENNMKRRSLGHCFFFYNAAQKTIKIEKEK